VFRGVTVGLLGVLVLAATARAASAQSGSVTLHLDGPTTAQAGTVLTYILAYTIAGGTQDIRLTWSDGEIEYLTSRLVSGMGQIAAEQQQLVRWSLAPGSGEVELRLRVPEMKQGGQFSVSASQPGTGTTGSSPVTTTIVSAAATATATATASPSATATAAPIGTPSPPKTGGGAQKSAQFQVLVTTAGLGIAAALTLLARRLTGWRTGRR
jgi:hypothetical protein